MAVDLPVIDADGHLQERESDIRKYLEPPWDQRGGGLFPLDQPWDNQLFDTLGQEHIHKSFAPADEVADWLKIMDEHGMEYAMLFPTLSGGISQVWETNWATALARAVNTLLAREYNVHTPRVQAVGVLPLQDPVAAAAELRRAVTELGLPSFELLAAGLRFGLGDPIYDPLWAEAARLGVPLCIHGSRQTSAAVDGDRFRSFAETHCYSFTAGLLLHFTSVLWQGVPLRFPGLKLAFLEIGATWLPYYLDRMDEHWEKRGELEAPHLPRKPSAVFRE